MPVLNVLVCLNCGLPELSEAQPGEPQGGKFLPHVCDMCVSEAAAEEGQ